MLHGQTWLRGEIRNSAQCCACKPCRGWYVVYNITTTSSTIIPQRSLCVVRMRLRNWSAPLVLRHPLIIVSFNPRPTHPEEWNAATHHIRINRRTEDSEPRTSDRHSLRPRVPRKHTPVIHPPATPFHRSFFARSPSIAHSVPLKMAPTLAKFLPLDTELRYMSRSPCFSCCFSGRSEMGTLALGERTEAGATEEAVTPARPRLRGVWMYLSRCWLRRP